LLYDGADGDGAGIAAAGVVASAELAAAPPFCTPPWWLHAPLPPLALVPSLHVTVVVPSAA
ncbi:MAG TPA: hypothetical protein VF931_12095, partial [Steroidobacteraceae bacterium]